MSDSAEPQIGAGYTPIVRTVTATGSASAPVVSGTDTLKQPYASGQTLSATVTIDGVAYSAKCTCATGSTAMTFSATVAPVKPGVAYSVSVTATVTVATGPYASLPFTTTLTWR